MVRSLNLRRRFCFAFDSWVYIERNPRYKMRMMMT